MTELDYCTFMQGMCNAPWNSESCEKCGGTGMIPIMCCNGDACGCRGMPVEFVDCDCGAKKPTDEQISRWAKKQTDTSGIDGVDI